MEVFRNVFLFIISDFLNVVNYGFRVIIDFMVWFWYVFKSDFCCFDKLFFDCSFFFGYIEESIEGVNYFFENDGGRYREDLLNI